MPEIEIGYLPHKLVGGALYLSGKTQTAARLTRYLLGLGSPDERERLESEYFTNDDAFEEMLTAEDDLIDAYARKELSAEEQHQFEQRFLKSAAVRERVQFARTLAGFVADSESVADSELPEKPSPYQPGFFASLQLPNLALRFAVVVVLLPLAVVTTWLMVQQGRMRNELQALRVERDSLRQKTEQLQQVADAERTRNADSTAQIEKLQQELAQKAEPEKQQVPRSGSEPRNADQKYARNNRNQKRQPEQVFADATLPKTLQGENVADLLPTQVFNLTPGAVRSEGGRSNTINVSKNAKFIVLRLGLEGAGHEYYRAVIETADGSQVRSFDRFKSTRAAQNVQLPPIPVSELPVGVYVIVLQAQQPDGSFLKVGDYSFTVSN